MREAPSRGTQRRKVGRRQQRAGATPQPAQAPPPPTSAAGKLRAERRAGCARVAERGGKVDVDEEDEVGELRAAGGGAAAQDEAAAAVVKSLSDIVSVGCSSVDPKCFTVRICNKV